MADRQRPKSWASSTDQELLGEYEKLVKKLQDPAYAGIDPSTTRDAPMHVLDRGTLASLESELERRGVTYTPAQGRVVPMPVAPKGPRPTVNTSAASTTPPTPTPAPAPNPAPATIHGQPADRVPKHLGGTLEPGMPIPQNIPEQPALPSHLTAPATATTSASTTTTKPIGRPVETAATKDRPRVIFQSGKEAGSATAKKPEQIIGQVIDDTAKRLNQEAKVVGRQTAHAGEKIGAGLRKSSQDISRALLDGTKGTRNIKLLGAAALIGAGGYMMSKKTHRSNVDYDRQLEMQRRRNIM